MIAWRAIAAAIAFFLIGAGMVGVLIYRLKTGSLTWSSNRWGMIAVMLVQGYLFYASYYMYRIAGRDRGDF